MDVISCVSLGWCLSLFSSLPTLYEKGVQVVWGAFDERPGVCVVFSGDLGVGGGVLFFTHNTIRAMAEPLLKIRGGQVEYYKEVGQVGRPLGKRGKLAFYASLARVRVSPFS